MTPLLAAADNPWAGVLLLLMFAVFIVGALLLGRWLGLKNSVSDRVYQGAVEGGKRMMLRKLHYRLLAEDYDSQAQVVESLVEYMQLTDKSPALAKIKRSLAGFERLRARLEKIHNDTIDIDVSGLKEERNA